MHQLSTSELAAVGLFLALVGIITYKLYPGTTRQRLDVALGVTVLIAGGMTIAYIWGIAVAAAAGLLVLIVFLAAVPLDTTRSWLITRGIGVILFGIMVYSLLN